MRMLKLDAKERDLKMSVDNIRKEGLLPVVVYGAKEETLSLTLVQAEFAKVWKEAGETSVITLSTPKGEKQVLIHEIQRGPVTNEPIHVDLYSVKKGQKVTVAVPLEFVGVAPAMKELSGNLVTVMHEIEIEAEPQNMPNSIEVDISLLVDFESHILVKDIKLASGLVAVTDAEETVALVAAAKEEEVIVEAVDLDSIDVEKKGKEEGEEEVEEKKS